MKKTMFALLAGLLAVSAAQAQTAADAPTVDTAPHAYVGVGVGVVSDPSAGGRRANAKVFGGYEFDRNWSAEAGLTAYRHSDFIIWDGNPQNGFSQGHVKSYSAYAAARYTIPINEKFAAYGKLGLSHNRREVSATWQGLTRSDHDTGLYAGLGAQYKLTKDVAALVEYERFGKRKDFGPKADVYSIGLKYGF